MFNPSFIDTSSVDYWYDEGCKHSQEVIREMSDVDFAEMAEGWETQSADWQDRLAYVLGWDMSAREAALLLAMYRVGPATVRLTAAESLRGLPLQLVSQALSPADADRLKAEAGQPTSINAILEWVSKDTR